MFTHLNNSSVTISRPTETNTALGVSESLTTVFTNLACRLTPPKGGEKKQWGKTQRYVDYVMYSAIVDIRQGDRVTYSNDTYEILDISTIRERGNFLRILLSLGK